VRSTIELQALVGRGVILGAARGQEREQQGQQTAGGAVQHEHNYDISRFIPVAQKK